MINFLLFCIASVGLTNILVESRLFAPIRYRLMSWLPPYLYEILECHQCTGTWCGFLCGWILISHQPLEVLLCGCAGSLLASWSALLNDFVLSKTQFEITDE